MSITIKNDSGATGTWAGQYLAIDETIVVSHGKYQRWTKDDAIAAFTSGDLKIIEVVSPESFFTAAQALRIIQQDDDVFHAGGSTGELLCTNPSGDLTWTPVVGGTVSFYSDGATNNKWLKVGDGQVQTSDKSPVVIPYDAVLYAMTFTNKTDSADMDFEIYKNGVLLFTWNVIDKRYGYKTNGLEAVTFSAGDRMSVFCISTGTTPNNPLLVINYSFQNATQGEGGSSTL